MIPPMIADIFRLKLTIVDSAPLIDPLYWHGRAPTVGYWALGITIALSWAVALCWIVYIIRKSRRESFDEQQEP